MLRRLAKDQCPYRAFDEDSSRLRPLFEFWAKSGREGEPAPMHSVPHHSLDVAAAAAVLLPAFKPPVAAPIDALTTLMALHDIGKFTRPFQAKVPELWPPSLGVFRNPPAGYQHDDAGLALLSGPLSSRELCRILGDGVDQAAW